MYHYIEFYHFYSHQNLVYENHKCNWKERKEGRTQSSNPTLRKGLLDLLEPLVLGKQQTEQDARFRRVEEAAPDCARAVCEGYFAVAGAGA
jgi:hypothetical protein